MKKQTLCFQKLLCFHYKYNLIFLDILCIILAIISSCIFYEYKTVAPRQELVDICENALYDYMENPVGYTLPDDVVISLKKNSISASIPKSFFEVTAYKNTDGSHQFVTIILFEKFIVSCIIFPILTFALNYFFFEIMMHLILAVTHKLINILKKLKTLFRIKLSKFIHTVERKIKSKGYKEYEDSRLKEIYQIGYNMGYANGLSESSKNNFNPMSQ